MRKLKQLHQLIHSLSMNEKRYFKIFWQGDEEEKTNYFQLFDILNQSKEYHQDNIDLALAEQPFYERLSYVQNYLRQQLLTAMLQFNKDSKHTYVTRRLLNEVDFLYEKNLKSQAKDSLRKLKKLAVEMEDMETIYRIHKWESIFLKLNKAHKDFGKQMNKVFEDDRQLLEAMEVRQTVKQVAIYMGDLHARGVDLRDSSERKALDKQMELLKNVRIPSQFSILTNHVLQVDLYFYYWLIGDNKNSLRYIKDLLTLLKDKTKSENLVRRHMVEVIRNCHELAVVMLDEKVKAEMEMEYGLYAQKVKASISEREKLLKELIFPNRNVIFQYNGKNYSAALELLPAYRQIIEKKKARIGKKELYEALFIVPFVLFHSSEFEAALEEVNNALAVSTARGYPIKLHIPMRMLEIMIHQELENRDLVQSLLRSLQRFLKGNARLFEVEKHFLKTYRKLTTLQDPSKIKDTFKTSAKKLAEICEKDPLEKRMDNTLGLQSFFERKAKLSKAIDFS